MEGLLGLDIGTSCVKAGLFDPHGRLLAAASAPLALSAPHPGWAEQTPEDWWQGACQTIRQVLAQSEPVHVVALALAGQCPGHVLVDRSHRAIGPAIIWRDQRATAEAGWLGEHISPALARECLGTDFLADPGSPPARLLWLKQHRAQDWQAAQTILQPKDYVALRLTSEMATDRHSAYCLVEPHSGRYQPAFFEAAGLEIEKLPPVLPPDAVLGQVSSAAASETGLQPGTPVITGTIDAFCDALAGGVMCPGRAVDVAGTSEVVSLAIPCPVAGQRIYPVEVNGEARFLCGPTQAGGETLRWLARGFFCELDFRQMESEAASVPPGCSGLVFLPYLNGERTPLWDADARGGYFGINFGHTRAHFTRAVYESIGYAVRHILELAEETAGAQATEIVVCGGGSRSAFWNQIKADILQRPVRPAVVSETGCLGAAMFAALGAQLYPSVTQAGQAMVALKAAVAPDPALSPVYADNYRIYRELYPALKPVFSRKI